MTVVALRGATTLDADTREQVLERTAELVGQLLDANGVDPADVISLLFTASADVTAEHPSAAVRAAGITDVPLLDAVAPQIEQPANLPRCVRVLAHVETQRARAELRHVYLHGARGLRPDLTR